MAEELAIKGGPRTVPEGMVRSWPPITQEDKDAVLAVFDSGHLHGTSAPQALALQKEWAEYCGCKYALVTNSGTSAIHMALAAAGIGPGDEVITSAFTYWSTAAAVLHQPVRAVFEDMRAYFPSENRCFINAHYRRLQAAAAGDSILTAVQSKRLVKNLKFGPYSRFFQLYFGRRAS